MATDKKVDKYYKKKAAERKAAQSEESKVETFTLQPLDSKKTFKVSVVAAFVVFASYMYTLWGGYVYCDRFNISGLRGITQEWASFWSNLVADALTSPLSQPLVKATFAGDIAFGTISSPAVFHGDSMCLHLANCILLFILAYKLTGLHNQRKRTLDLDPVAVGAGAALLFACHPLTCESVAYISARAALLTTLNYFLALLFFLRGFLAKRIKDGLIGYGLCYLFMILAIWSSPQGLTIAASMLVLALMLKPQEEMWSKWLNYRPLELFSIVLVASVVPFVLLLKYKAPIGNGFGLENLPTVAYIATQCKALVTYYLRVMVVPFGLSLDPPMVMAEGFNDPLAIVGALIPIAVLALAWKFRSSLLVSFSLILFVLGLLPDFITVQPELIADRRMYLPLAALCIVIGVGVAQASAKRFVATLVTGVIVCLAFIGLTNYRNHMWQSDFKLWSDALSMNKDSERSKIMLAFSKTRGGKIEEAGKEAEEMLKKNPDSAILNLVLAQYYAVVERKFKNARDCFKKALALADKQHLSPEVVWELQKGYAYTSMHSDDLKTAKEYADKASDTQPNDSVLHLVKGVYYLNDDQPQAAFAELQDAHILDRYNPEILVPLARAAIGCGKPEYQDLGYKISQEAARVFNHRDMDLLRAYGALETGHALDALAYIKLYQQQGGQPTAEMYWLVYGICKISNRTAEANAALKLALAMDPNIKKKMRLYLNRPLSLDSKAPLIPGRVTGSPPPPAGQANPTAPQTVPQPAGQAKPPAPQAVPQPTGQAQPPVTPPTTPGKK